MNKPVVAFFGYAPPADEATDRAITAFHTVLQARVRARTGRREFELWRDNLSIRWGQAWEARLLGAIDEALFCIPVLTPDFFESDWCAREATAFLDRIARGDTRTRVLPVYLLTDLRLDRPAMRRLSPIRERIHKHQYRDLRAHLDHGWAVVDAKQAVNALADEIADRVVELDHEEEVIARVGPMVERGQLGSAANELEESGFADEAARCRAVEAALRAGRNTTALELAEAARNGLLGRAWAAFAATIRRAEEEARVAEDARKAEQARKAATADTGDDPEERTVLAPSRPSRRPTTRPDSPHRPPRPRPPPPRVHPRRHVPDGQPRRRRA